MLGVQAMTRRIETFRDHCRKMAAAEHKPDICPTLTATPPERLIPKYEGGEFWGFYVNIEAFSWKPPHCPGCNTESDRALFAQLAAETDRYLQGELFEETP